MIAPSNDAAVTLSPGRLSLAPLPGGLSLAPLPGDPPVQAALEQPGPGVAALLPAAPEATRVRLGASADTAPDVLLSLANDPAVTVRAAVAMNMAASGDVDTVLACDRDQRVRTLLARKLASLVPGMTLSDRDALRERALTTLYQLADDEAVRVREAIADVLKDMTAAPRNLILRLARDSALAVSDPVIRLSPLLTAADLLALLAAAPGGRVATSVAGRLHLAEEVADAVAATDDSQAITALLENTSAAIREATLDALAVKARHHEPWQRPLVQRPLLSDRAARALSDFVTSQLLDTLAGRADLSLSVAAELRERLAARLHAALPKPRRDPDFEQAMAEARHLHAQNLLDEAVLIGAVQRGEMRVATALLAVAAELPASVVNRAATLRSAKGLVSLVWKAGFTMNVAGPLQMLLARLNPGAVLRPTGGGGFPLAVDEMRWQIEFLRDMGR